MWPWEHLACGYLVYSLAVRYLGGKRPGRAGVVALVFGTQFPDLVDKPLGWGTTLLPSGISFAHSLLVAVPLSLAILVVTRAIGRTGIGVAFAVGYLVHLPGDAIYPLLVGGELRLGFLFWPLVPATDVGTVSVFTYVRHLGAQFLEFLETPRGRLYLLVEVLLVSAAALRWHADGLPGLRWPVGSWVWGR